MRLILSLSLAWLINQAKPSSIFFIFPRAQTQILFLGLSQAQTKLKLLIFPDEPSLNMHYSTKLGLFTTLLVWLHVASSRNIFRVCLDTTYFAKIENLLLKVLYIKKKISWNSTVGFINSTKKCNGTHK